MSVRRATGILSSSRVAASSWTPASLPSLFGWYDADDAATFSYSSGTVVSEWRDKSGNARHLTPTGAGPSRSSTINSRSAVAFTGTTNETMGSTTFTAPSLPVTYLIVATSTGTGQRTLFVPTTEGRVFRTSGGTIDAFAGSFLSTGASWGSGAAKSVVAVFNGASSKIAANGAAYTTGTSGGSWGGTAWRLGSFGSAERWVGDVCEIAVTSNEISSGDLASWWTYTSTKWAYS